MAKQYRALSNIEHGEEEVGQDGMTSVTTHRFPFGSIVEGLDADTMKNLWDAGVLEEVAETPQAATKTVTTSRTSDEDKAAADKKAAEDKAAADKEAAERASAAGGSGTNPPAAPSGRSGASPSAQSNK